MNTQSRRQRITSSFNGPPSSSFPQGEGSSWRRAPAVDPELHTMDPDNQRSRPTFPTFSVYPSSINYSSSAAPINETLTNAPGDYSLNNAYNSDNRVDNRVNNRHIEISNSFSRVFATTYANDVTHVHIRTINIQSPGDQEGRKQTRKWQGKKPRSKDSSRTWWGKLSCFY